MTQVTVQESSTALEVDKDGTYLAVLITPGQGSSGFYSEEMLKATGPEAFPAGSHSYLNHSKDGSRSPDKLLAVTVEDAWYKEGVGLVARTKPMKHWRDFVSEVAPYVGLSIQAAAVGEQGEVDGRETLIVESLVPHVMNSIDLVSYAGRGGHIAEQLAEAALSTQTESSAGTDKKDDEHMPTVEEGLAALNATVAGLVTAQEQAATAAAEVAEADERVAEARKAAVAATRKVAEAGLSAKLADRIYADIENGNFEVDESIKDAKELIDAVREELTPANYLAGGFASESANSDDNFGVGKWS